MNGTAYFARPITQFRTQLDVFDICDINELGFDVIDITSPDVQAMYQAKGMKMFKKLVKGSDVLFFKSFDNGWIGAGVAKEIWWAKKAGIPVFEFPNSIEYRTLDVRDTRAQIKSIREHKAQ